jgi:hypothetical protein
MSERRVSATDPPLLHYRFNCLGADLFWMNGVRAPTDIFSLGLSGQFAGTS